jgi:Melibiase
MSTLTLKNHNTQLDVALNGEYQLKINNFDFKNCRPLLFCDGNEYPLNDWKEISSDAKKILLETSNELGKWFLKFTIDAKNGVSIQTYGELLAVQKDIKLLVMDLPLLDADHLLAQGVVMGRCDCKLLKNIEKQDFESHYQLMLTKDDSTLQLAFPMRQTQPNEFNGIIEDGQVKKLQAFTNVHNFGGTKIEADTLTLKCDTNGFALMEAYADENLENEKDLSGAFPAGWNSWDYYRWTISEEEVLKNAEFIANDPVLSKYVKRIILDDGWQYCYGEWEANHYFPNGMKYLAEKLTELGFEPGLWFAPTIVEPHSPIAQMDYDMLACSEGGQPCFAYECMGRKGFLLDPTQEKVDKHLRKIFSDYADMGYKYFKLDFMGQTLKAKKFADPMIPHSEIARLIVKSVYEEVSDRAVVLGCNYQFKGGTDYVDAVRVGGDIHARWEAIKSNTVSVAARFWTNRRLWINDPDFALCRALDTSDEKDINRLQPALVGVSPEDHDPEAGAFMQVDIKRAQSEILLSIVMAAGGAVNLSDKMYMLNESGLDLARRIVSAEVGDTAIPLDLFKSDLPAHWLQKVGDKHRVLLINWSDEAKKMSFNLNQYGISTNEAVNFWNDEAVKINNNRIEATIEPRSCLLAIVG